jgi:hypothetical protein
MQDLRTNASGTLDQDGPKYFLIWIAVWMVALAVLLPTLS